MAPHGTARLVGWVARSSLAGDETTRPSTSFQEAPSLFAARRISSLPFVFGQPINANATSSEP